MQTTKKTAVSIPIRLFERAERLARRRGIGRSQLYAQALEKALDEAETDHEVTAQLNEVYAQIHAHPHPDDRAWEEFRKRSVQRSFERWQREDADE